MTPGRCARRAGPPGAGKFVSLQGTVVRMSPVRPLVLEMPFVCGKCGEVQQQAFADGKFTPPTRCPGEDALRPACRPAHTARSLFPRALLEGDWSGMREAATRASKVSGRLRDVRTEATLRQKVPDAPGQRVQGQGV